jgi:hypothetical protein
MKTGKTFSELSALRAEQGEKNFTHDLSSVCIGDTMISRTGDKYVVTDIIRDDAGNLTYWEDNIQFAQQYSQGHNMLTKSPFWKIIPKPVEQSSILSAEEWVKDIAIKFFYYWWNTPGNNTSEGFDEWWKLHKKEYSQFEGKELPGEELRSELIQFLSESPFLILPPDKDCIDIVDSYLKNR